MSSRVSQQRFRNPDDSRPLCRRSMNLPRRQLLKGQQRISAERNLSNSIKSSLKGLDIFLVVFRQRTASYSLPSAGERDAFAPQDAKLKLLILIRNSRQDTHPSLQLSLDPWTTTLLPLLIECAMLYLISSHLVVLRLQSVPVNYTLCALQYNFESSDNLKTIAKWNLQVPCAGSCNNDTSRVTSST